MKSIIIDLEMNEIDLEKNPMPPKTCRFEIMEIGAVMLDENLQQIDEFKEYVKPQMNQIGERYTELTGITNEMVENADNFVPVFNRFLEWCKDDYKIFSWGGTDKVQVKRECAYKGIEVEKIKYMLKNWVDFQSQFSKTLGIYKSVALKDAVNYAGIEVEGKLHDAYWDAKNTASLYVLFKDADKLKEVMKPYVDSMKKKQTMTFSLGDLLKDIVVDDKAKENKDDELETDYDNGILSGGSSND